MSLQHSDPPPASLDLNSPDFKNQRVAIRAALITNLVYLSGGLNSLNEYSQRRFQSVETCPQTAAISFIVGTLNNFARQNCNVPPTDSIFSDGQFTMAKYGNTRFPTSSKSVEHANPLEILLRFAREKSTTITNAPQLPEGVTQELWDDAALSDFLSKLQSTEGEARNQSESSFRRIGSGVRPIDASFRPRLGPTPETPRQARRVVDTTDATKALPVGGSASLLTPQVPAPSQSLPVPKLVEQLTAFGLWPITFDGRMIGTGFPNMRFLRLGGSRVPGDGNVTLTLIYQVADSSSQSATTERHAVASQEDLLDRRMLYIHPPDSPALPILSIGAEFEVPEAATMSLSESTFTLELRRRHQ